MKLTIKTICNKIWEFECEYKPNSQLPYGIAIWEIIRVKLYYHLTLNSDLFSKPHQGFSDNSLQHKCSVIVRLIYNSIFKNSFLSAITKKSSIAIIEHGRKQTLHGINQDIYVHKLKLGLKAENVSFVSLRRPYPAKIAEEQTKEHEKVIYLDIFTIVGQIGRYCGPMLYLKRREKYKLTALVDEISNAFPTLNWSINYFIGELARFIVLRNCYKLLFILLKTKQLYVVVGYAVPEAISAAKNLGIEVIEIQHGIISKYHLGYSYPQASNNEETKLNYFPDKLLLWGPHWVLDCTFPIHTDKIDDTYGWPLQKQQYIQKNQPENASSEITIISQGALGGLILEKTLALLDYLPPNVKVNYKLHPSEFSIYQLYPQYDALIQDDRIEVLTTCDLPALLRRSSLVFGVFSTALIEAREMGCDIWIFPLPGREYFENIPWAQSTENFDSNVLSGGSCGN